MELQSGSIMKTPPPPFFDASSPDPSAEGLAKVGDGHATLRASKASDLNSSSVWCSLAWMPGMSRIMTGVSARQFS